MGSGVMKCGAQIHHIRFGLYISFSNLKLPERRINNFIFHEFFK